jgi:membrane protein YdbS with pleckstrin-like domain
MHNAANFCSHCGKEATSGSGGSNRPAARSSASVIRLSPTFIPWLSVLSVIPFQIFMTIWGALFFGGFATVGLQALDTGLPRWAPFVIAGALFFFGIPLLAFLTKQKTYAKTTYNFFEDKLDYFEGFFTTEEKTIDYKNITEVNLRKSVFQKMYGLGTIILSTPATGYAHGRARSGIHIRDIPHPDRVYQQVKALIKRR